MGLFSRWFRSNTDIFREALDEAGPEPQPAARESFSLKYPPIPENGAKLAAITVEAARDIYSVELDYSPRSLADVDQILLRFHAKGYGVGEIGGSTFTLGCYAGEVFIRNVGGAWKLPADTELPDAIKAESTTMVVAFPNGNVVNPIGKAFKRLETGDEDSLAYLYEAFPKES